MIFVRRWMPLLLALVAVVTGGLLLARAGDDGLDRRHVVVDGVPLDEVRPSSPSGGPGVVVAHGFAGSARLMAQFGDTLAARGYTVVLPDLDGHGASTRSPADLQHDLDVAITHLRGMPGVDPARTALVGHSMGAGAVTTYAAGHDAIAATVAISLPGSEPVPPDRPARLLLLVGQLEFAGFRQTAEAAVERASGDRRAVVVPGVEHISILYSPRTHRLTADWLDDSFGRPRAEEPLPSPVRRLAAAGVLLLGLLLGFPAVARLLLGSPPRASGAVAHLGRVAAVAAGTALVAVLVAPVLPTVRLPLELGGHVAGFTAVMGAAILACLRSLSSAPGGLRSLLVAPLLIAYAAGAIAVPLHLGFTHAVPVGARWWLLPVVWAGFAVLAYATDRLGRGFLPGELIVSAIAVAALTAAAVAGLASGFLLLVVPLLAVLLLIQAGLSAVLRLSSAPSWLIALTGSLLVAWPIATTLPIAA